MLHPEFVNGGTAWGTVIASSASTRVSETGQRVPALLIRVHGSVLAVLRGISLHLPSHR